MTDIGFKIHVTKTGYESLDGEWEVCFSNGYAMYGKDITFCMMRKGILCPPHAGCSIQNPKDAPDPDRGRHNAFKRTIETFAVVRMMKHKDKQQVIDRFRGALWIAMGRPGDKRHLVPEGMSPHLKDYTLKFAKG